MREDAGQKGIKGRKKWDNCNTIINEILKKKEKEISGEKVKLYFVNL